MKQTDEVRLLKKVINLGKKVVLLVNCACSTRKNLCTLREMSQKNITIGSTMINGSKWLLTGQSNQIDNQAISIIKSDVDLNLDLILEGLIHEVFTMVLRSLSGTKLTRPGKFRRCLDGYAVKSSLKAEDGVPYPLEKSIFFLPKPPTLILYNKIDYVEFERHAAGGSNMHYFDLLIRPKTKQHLFRNI
ncbi:hypothetical protein L1887_10166 [Cichorium endivia]|nr:hypothetical protein L1887_10166 [Cichorium endivia]